jgi:uncharacterized protein
VSTATSSMPHKGTSNTAPRGLGHDVGILVRKMGLTYGDDMPSLWFDNNAFLSMYFTAFSAVLPQGEAQFIHSVRLFQDRIKDPVLLAKVRAFIGQEGHHSKEHTALNDAMKKRGFDIAKIERRVAKDLAFWKRQAPEAQLAMTVCSEHYTALLADFAVSKDPTALERIAPPARTIWAWHCIEELEHKSVAFDVYDQLVGDRDLLRRTMVRVTAWSIYATVTDAFKLMPHAGHMTDWRMWKEAFGFLGGMRNALWKDYMDFYKRDFHPGQHDSSRALDAARLKYLGQTA